MALRDIDPLGVDSRNPRLRQHPLPRQENYSTLGPDEIWSADGHDKLAHWGFQIYAAIDAYSRRMTWIYCGNANRSSIACLYQYLQVVKTLGYCPRFLRTDKGGETVLFAALHYDLFRHALNVPGAVDADGMDLARPDCCFIWGSSPRNVRIERIWFQQRHTVTARWEGLFGAIEGARLYRSTNVVDHIVIQFVFMPLLRKELGQFVEDKNAYPIRRQRQRSGHVHGVPNELYYQEGPRYGFPIDEQILLQWEASLTRFSKRHLTASLSIELMAKILTLTLPLRRRRGASTL